MRKFSRKKFSAVGLAVLMSAQGPVMAAEVEGSQETKAQETTSEIPSEESESTEETVAETAASEQDLTEEPTVESTEQSELAETEETSEESDETSSETVPESASEVQTEAESEDETEALGDDGIQVEGNQIAVQIADGWQLDADGKYTYVKDGQIVKNCVIQINGAYYGFDENGIMYAGETFVYNYGHYRAKADGSLYISEWYQNKGGTWYYYDGSGRLLRYEAATIGGKIYYFGWDGLVTGATYLIDGKYYLANEGGERVLSVGWYKQGDSWYYVKDDGTLYTGYLTDGGYTYWLNPAMIVNASLLESGYDGDDMVYATDENGHVVACADGFLGAPEGGPTYYVSGGKIVKDDWVNVNGKWYYFNSVGLMVKNDSIRINDKAYYFYSDGSMAANGWILGGYGNWYYANASGELATGDVSIGGTQYHFDEFGLLLTGVIKTENGYMLYGDGGEELGAINSEGWNLVDGNYYYLKDGALVIGTDYQTADGAWYSFDYLGRMKKNKSDGLRWYSDVGWAYVGWFLKAGTWYYADPQTANIYRGFQTINGTEYYFSDYDGAMLVGEAVVDDKVVITDASGKVLSKDIAADGWSRHDGEYYYYKNGKPYTGWVGAYYISDGRMLRNTWFTDTEGGEYWVDMYGVYQTNTWVDDGNSYAKADGTLAKDEWLIIGDKTYYFDDINKETESFGKDGCVYILDADGAYIRTVELDAGWNLVDGEYYYKAGNRLPSGRTEVNGSKYYFVNGKMQTNLTTVNGLFDGYYDFCYGADGRSITGPGWVSLNGNWFYLNSQSQYVTGWAVIDGNKYYFKTGTEAANDSDIWGTVRFEECGIMCTGYYVISNKLYYFDQNGVCQGVCGPKDGWFKADGSWYFMKGGEVSTGIVTVNGIEYIFGRDGKMYADTVTGSYSGLYYVNADGAVVTKQGWILTSAGYVYVQANGLVCTGVQVINGVTYYFGTDGIWIC